jgi:hypothetical protein
VHQNPCAALKQAQSTGEVRADEVATVLRNAFTKMRFLREAQTKLSSPA